jgi:hypothetical protein
MSRRNHSFLRALALILFISGESLAQLSTGVVEKLDRVHEWTFMKLNSGVNHFDRVVGGSDPFQGSATNSEFRLTLYTEVKSGSVNEFSIEPDYSMDLNLPRIERRFHLFVNNFAPDELPGQNPLDEKRSTYLGVRQSLKWTKRLGLDTSAGIKWRLPPVLFAQAQLKRRVEKGKWMVEPKQSVFWFSDDDGFGEKTGLTVEYWENPKTFIRSAAGVRWTEGTEGVEWSHVLSTGYILQGDKEDMRKTIGARFVAAGHKSGSGVMDSYRADIAWRAPLYKDWLFYIINPGITWDSSHDWESTRTLIVGVDMFFSSASE